MPAFIPMIIVRLTEILIGNVVGLVNLEIKGLIQTTMALMKY